MGSIGCVRCEKIPTRLRGTNFFTSSACFALSFVRQPNSPKCTQIVGNATKHEFRVQWGGSGAFVVKNSDTTSFCSEIGKATKWSQMPQNGTKHTKTRVYGPIGWIRCVRSKMI